METTQPYEPRTITLYVKSCTNCPGGMELLLFEQLSEEWTGSVMSLKVGDELKFVTGWSDLLTENPYPDVCPGKPVQVHVVHARDEENRRGYLVYGGSCGLRIGGRGGWGQPILWYAAISELPQAVRKVVRKPYVPEQDDVPLEGGEASHV